MRPGQELGHRHRVGHRPQHPALLGYQGTGKTTQLRRLRRQLEAAGYRVFYLDVEDYLNTALQVDVADYLLFLAGALSDLLEDEEPNGQPRGKGFWERIKSRFGEWGLDGVSLGMPAGLGSIDLKRNLKDDPTFLERLRKGAAGYLAHLTEEVRTFLAEVGQRLGNKAVLLVDSTDHFQGSTLNAEEVQASVQALFANHHDKLKLPVHSVYTVPSYLKARFKNIVNLYGGGALTVVPAIKVHRGEGTIPIRSGSRRCGE